MSFFTLAEGEYLAENEAFATLRTMLCRKCSLQNLTQLSQGSNLLDDSAPNTQVVLWRETCFFSKAE